MIKTAATGASVLVAGVTMFQLALALGLPMGTPPWEVEHPRSTVS